METPHKKMKSHQVLELLLARMETMQEEMRSDREEMRADRKADCEKWKAWREEMDASHKEMVAEIKPETDVKMMAFREMMEAYLDKANLSVQET
jgi:hypothetical protein